MESRKDLRTRESEWRAQRNDAPKGDVFTKRIPEAPVVPKFKSRSAA